jgi:hypothetical protein
VGESSRVGALVHLEAIFPSLAGDDYAKTSEPTDQYNCFAFAAGDVLSWWGPPPDGYWPPGVEYGRSPESLLAAFATAGYAECESCDPEAGFEKIAIYAHPDTLKVTHAARQLDSGRWTSKLGGLEDIEHATLAQLQCVPGSFSYGYAVRYAKRPRNGASATDSPNHY